MQRTKGIGMQHFQEKRNEQLLSKKREAYAKKRKLMIDC